MGLWWHLASCTVIVCLFIRCPILVTFLSDGRPDTVYVIIILISLVPGRQKMCNLYLLNELIPYTELIECACTQEEPNVEGPHYEVVGL